MLNLCVFVSRDFQRKRNVSELILYIQVERNYVAYNGCEHSYWYDRTHISWATSNLWLHIIFAYYCYVHVTFHWTFVIHNTILTQKVKHPWRLLYYGKNKFSFCIKSMFNFIIVCCNSCKLNYRWRNSVRYMHSTICFKNVVLASRN